MKQLPAFVQLAQAVIDTATASRGQHDRLAEALGLAPVDLTELVDRAQTDEPVPPTGVRPDEKPTALVLTQQEWEDLARICHAYWYDHSQIDPRLDDLIRRVKEAARS